MDQSAKLEEKLSLVLVIQGQNNGRAEGDYLFKK